MNTLAAWCGYVVTGCWLVLVVYWLVNSASVKATAERQSLWGILSTRIPLILGVFILLWRHAPEPLGMILFGPVSVRGPLGAAACGCGLWIAIWARWTLADNWSATVTFQQGHELIERGPYRFVRHPIYTGLITMFLGSAILVGRMSSLIGLACYIAGFWLKSRQEEALMMQHFPQAYPEYKKKVRALVPLVF